MSRSDAPYEIVPYEARHRDAILRLRAELHAIDPRWNEEHFRWQQEENPWFEGHLMRLALFEGRVVAMRILQPAVWEAGSRLRRFRAPVFVGTYIHPAHRRRGLFGELTGAVETDLAKRGIGWALNLSAGPATFVASMAEGWRSIGPLAGVQRESSISGLRPLQRIRRNAARFAGRWKRSAPGVRISDEPLSQAMADVAQSQAEQDGRIRRVRDETFFRWRFRDPSSRYRFVYVERGGALAGFVALQRPASSRRRAGTFHIADWGLAGDLSWRELLHSIVDYADRIQQGLATWSVPLPAAARALLPELGFEPSKEPGPFARARPTLLVRKIGADDASSAWAIRGQPIDDLRGWDLRMTDSDVY